MLPSANTCGKSTKVTDFMVYPMKVTVFHKHITSSIVRKSRKTCYTIYARVKIHTHTHTHTHTKSAMDSSVHGPKTTTKQEPKIALSILCTIHTQCRQMT